jgi:paraquat-inducible protein B
MSDTEPMPTDSKSIALNPVADQAAESKFPLAEIEEVKATSAIIFQSRMWWVTLVCFILAFWLTWRAIPSKGPSIVIQFPDGHGLKAGDAVRHRGIEVGLVESVALSDNLSQITANVTLTPGASGLAREGTRFWIVRPQLSFAGVSGLDTAVGAKYIAVSPGDPSASLKSSFEGLSAAPPDENFGEGIDVVLRSDAKHGVSVGAPVGWRGVEVGQILSINLSPDARFVDVHARINSEYKRLIRSTSQFWVTSGLGIDVGLSGLRLNADSLTTIVRGGVSFATPGVGKDKNPIQPGHVFVLHEKPDPQWLEPGSSLPLIDFDLPPTVTIQGSRKTSFLGVPRTSRFTANGLLVQREDGPAILTAAEVLVGDGTVTDGEKPPDQEFAIGSAITDGTIALTYSVPAESAVPPDGLGMAWLPTTNVDLNSLPKVQTSIFRVPTDPEECCICRSVKADGEASSVIQSIGRAQLKVTESMWAVTTDLGDLSPWHGAPVVSMQDGKVIGVFVAGKSGAMIAPSRMTGPEK